MPLSDSGKSRRVDAIEECPGVLSNLIATETPDVIEDLDPATYFAAQVKSLFAVDPATVQMPSSCQPKRFSRGALPEGALICFGSKKYPLWAHQAISVARATQQMLSGINEIVIADSVGGGKTGQALGVAMNLFKEGLIENLVIFAPRLTIKDWQTAIKDFTGEEAVTISQHADLNKLSGGEQAQPKFFVINQSIQKITASVFSGVIDPTRTLLISDESPKLSCQWKGCLYQLKSEFSFPFRTIHLSGTVISSQFSDLNNLLVGDALDVPQVYSWFKDVASAFNAVLAVQSGNGAVGKGLLALYNIMALLKLKLQMRPRDCLNLNIPPFNLQYHEVGEKKDQIAINSARVDVNKIFSMSGAVVILLKAIYGQYVNDRRLTGEADDPLYIKTRALIDAAENGTGVLVFCATDKELCKMRELLQATYTDRQFYQATNSAHRGKIFERDAPATIFLASLNDAQGFNIQDLFPRGLKTIIMPCTRNASELDQAIGRAVRPLAKPLGGEVSVHVVMRSGWRNYMEMLVKGKIKGKSTLVALLASARETFKLIVLDTISNKQKANPGEAVISQEVIDSEIRESIALLLSGLNKENVLPREDFIALIVSGDSALSKTPLLFGRYDDFHNGKNDALWKKIENVVFSDLKEKFIASIVDINLNQLLSSHVMHIAEQYNCFDVLVNRFLDLYNGNIALSELDAYTKFLNHFATRQLGGKRVETARSVVAKMRRPSSGKSVAPNFFQPKPKPPGTDFSSGVPASLVDGDKRRATFSDVDSCCSSSKAPRRGPEDAVTNSFRVRPNPLSGAGPSFVPPAPSLPLGKLQQVQFVGQPLGQPQQVQFRGQPLGQPQQVQFRGQALGQSQQVQFRGQALGQPQQVQFVGQPLEQPQQVQFRGQALGQPQQVQFRGQALGQPQQVQFVGQALGQSQQVQFVGQALGQSQQVQFVGQALGQSQQVQFVGQALGQSQQVQFVGQALGQSQQVQFVGQALGQPQQVQFVGQPLGQSQQVQFVAQPLGQSQQVQFVGQPLGQSQQVQFVGQPLGQPQQGQLRGQPFSLVVLSSPGQSTYANTGSASFFPAPGGAATLQQGLSASSMRMHLPGQPGMPRPSYQ